MAVLLAACGGSSSTNPARDAVLAQAEVAFAEQAGIEELSESLEDYVACLLDDVVEELDLSWAEVESALEETGDLSSLGSGTDDMPDGVLLCLGELTSADLELLGVSEGLFESSADAYGDDPVLDALWDACEAGDAVACDDLYMQSPFGSEYESFALDNGGSGGGFFDSGSDADSYGDDPELDALWDACEGGDAVACDDLYWQSPVGSEYESFAEENRSFGSDADSYGDDPRLDALWDACEAGDAVACDDLYWQSPVGSEYEEFGRGNGSFGADSYGDDPELDALWDACEAGDDAACSDLFWQSPIGSEYESFGSSCAGRGCEP